MGKKRRNQQNDKAAQRSGDLNVQLNLLAAQHGYDVLGGDAAALTNTQNVAGSAFTHHRNLHEVAAKERRRPIGPGPPVKIDIGADNKVKKGGDSMIRRRSGLTTQLRLNAAKTRTMKIGPQTGDGGGGSSIGDGGSSVGDGGRGPGQGNTSSAGRSGREEGNSKAAKRKRKRRDKEAAGNNSKVARTVGDGATKRITSVLGDGGGSVSGGGSGGGAGGGGAGAVAGGTSGGGSGGRGGGKAAAAAAAAAAVPKAALAATLNKERVEVDDDLKWTEGHQAFLDATHWNLPKGVQAGSLAAVATALRFKPNTSPTPLPTTAAGAAIVMIRDAREAICKLRTPMWCLSCVNNAEQMLLQTGDAALQGEGATLLRNVRKQLVQAGGSARKGDRKGGKDSLTVKTLIKVLIDLDEVYFKCQYFTSTTGFSDGEVAITPVAYFRSTGPALELSAAAVAKFKSSPEMQNGGSTLGLLKWSAKAGATTVPSTPSNPLFEALRLRFVETVVLFHHSGLANDGRLQDALVASRAGGSDAGASQHQHSNQKQKKGKKNKNKRAAAAAAAGGSDAKAAAVATANEPVCDELLASWRDSCRDWLARFYGFATPNKAALVAIKKVGPLVEVGAGTGYWTSLLRGRGADIVSYDVAPTPMATAGGASRSKSKKGSSKQHAVINEYHGDVPGFTEVLQGGAQCAADHKERALFLCYPPPAEPMAADTLQAYAGNCVVYAGEWRGLTADALFEALLQKSFQLESRLSLPNFGNQASQLTIWRRRSRHDVAADSSGSGGCTMLACKGCGTVTTPARRCKLCREIIFCSSECASKYDAEHTRIHALKHIFAESSQQWPEDYSSI